MPEPQSLSKYEEARHPPISTGTVARSKRPAGFTLIETIVVLVILGLALSVMASFLPKRNTVLELSATTDRVANALRLARSRAIATISAVTFVVEPDGHGYSIDSRRQALDPAVTLAMRPPGTIRFSPDGSATGATLVIALNGRQRVVRVDWLTGRVTVQAAPDRIAAAGEF